MGIGEAALSQGDVMRRLRVLERAIREMQGARRLENASVGAGGIRVHSGGGVLLQDGGNLAVRDGGDVELAGGGQLRVVDGGTIIVGGDEDGTVELRSGRVLVNSGLPAETSGQLMARVKIVDGQPRPVTWLTAPALDGGDIWDNYIGVEAAGSTLGTAFMVTHGDAGIDGGGQVAVMSGSGSSMLYTDSGHSQVWSNNRCSVVGNDVTLGGAGELRVRMANTTGSANVVIGGPDPALWYLLRRITSSAASKLDLEDVDLDPDRVLKLRPRTWRDKAEVEDDPATDRWHVGYVAEEVDALGLTEFVDYDEDGQPCSVTYDRMSVALLEVVKRQQRQIDQLTRAVELLTGDTLAEPEAKRQRRTRKPKRRAAGPAAGSADAGRQMSLPRRQQPGRPGIEVPRIGRRSERPRPTR